MNEQVQRKWYWQATKEAYLDADFGVDEIPPAWGHFPSPETAHAGAQSKGWDFGEYVVFEEGGKPIPTIEALLAEVGRLRAILDAQCPDCSGTCHCC